MQLIFGIKSHDLVLYLACLHTVLSACLPPHDLACLHVLALTLWWTLRAECIKQCCCRRWASPKSVAANVSLPLGNDGYRASPAAALAVRGYTGNGLGRLNLKGGH